MERRGQNNLGMLQRPIMDRKLLDTWHTSEQSVLLFVLPDALSAHLLKPCDLWARKAKVLGKCPQNRRTGKNTANSHVMPQKVTELLLTPNGQKLNF